MVCDTNMGMNLKAVLLIISLKDIRIIAPTDKMGDFSCELKTPKCSQRMVEKLIIYHQLTYKHLKRCCKREGKKYFFIANRNT